MKKAISFMELIIVLSIIVMMTAITIPLMRNYLPSWQLTGTTRALLSDLRQAQEEAVTTQIPHQINFISLDSPVTYQLAKVEGENPILETITMPKTVSIEFETIVNPITFYKDGGPSTNGTIILKYTESGATKKITISPSGIIKFESATSSPTPTPSFTSTLTPTPTLTPTQTTTPTEIPTTSPIPSPSESPTTSPTPTTTPTPTIS